MIKKKMQEYDRRKMIEMSMKYKKIDYDSFSKDDFKLKDYIKELPVDSARMKFKIVSHMTPLAMNQKSVKKYRERGWVCLGCRSLSVGGGDGGDEGEEGNIPDLGEGEGAPLETDDHVINHCLAYADLRAGKQLLRDRDIVEFYAQVLERRKNLSD